MINAFLKLKGGKVLSLPQAIHENMTEIVCKTERPVTVNVDGELYDDVPFDIKIVSDKLRVFRP